MLLVATASKAQMQSAPAPFIPIKSVANGDTVLKTGGHIRSIFQDNKNNYWFASDGEGLFKYDGATLLRFTSKHGLPDNFVRFIEQDKSGTLLIVCGKSTCTFDGNQFHPVQPAENTKPATGYPGAILLAGDYFQNDLLSHFQLPQTSRLNKNFSVAPYAIYCSFRDSKGNTWFGTESRGVCKYDGKTFTWLDEEVLGLPIRSIFEDKKGNIWIGNNGYGLFRYDGKTLTSITKEYQLENPGFRTTLKGKEGTLARVWVITGDQQGNLWIGTIDAGLWKYNGTAFTCYTTKDGLAGNSIEALLYDTNGTLWIGTDKGVTKYNGSTFNDFKGINSGK